MWDPASNSLLYKEELDIPVEFSHKMGGYILGFQYYVTDEYLWCEEERLVEESFLGRKFRVDLAAPFQREPVGDELWAEHIKDAPSWVNAEG